MSQKTTSQIEQLLARFFRETMQDLPAEQRAQFQQQFSARTEELLRGAANGGSATAFADLLGLGGKAAPPFEDLPHAHIEPDFDSAVIEDQLHRVADLYYVYQHERMKVFQVVGVLLRLFHQGRMRIQSGPGARALYLVEKYHPLRYKVRDRMLAYRRAFNYGSLTAPAGAAVYRDFHRQFVAFNAAIAQYFRDLLIGEVIRGSQNIEQRPFGSQATIQRLGIDLRWHLDRATYGNIYSLVTETLNYLQSVLEMLDTPDIKKAFDAHTKWDVIEVVSQRYLGGIGEISQRSKMADSGRVLLKHIANSDFGQRDFHLFQTEIQPLGTVAEEWLAAYRMTPEGRSFRGVAPALRAMLGNPASAAS